MSENPLDQVIFISLPEQLTLPADSLSLDTTILLPVDTSPSNPENWKMSDLSWESIESGLLKVLAWDPEREHIPYYRKLLLQLHPGISEDLLRMAISKTSTKDFELAEELFHAILSITPDDSAAYLNRAVFYEAKARHFQSLVKEDAAQELFDKAGQDFSKSLSLSPVQVDVYYLAGLFYYSRGEFKYAYSLLNSFIDLTDKSDPRRERAIRSAQTIKGLEAEKDLYQQAFSDIENEKNAQGIEKIRHFLKTSPGSWNGWFLLGWGLRKEQQWNEALEAFSKALELEKQIPDLFNEMAICHMELSQFEESQALLEQAYKLNPEDLRIISNLAILALKKGNPAQAEKWFKEVLKKDPQDELALNYLDYLN